MWSGLLSTIGLSLEKTIIMHKLEMFIEKPDDLEKYVTRVIKSNWSDEKKDKWAQVIQEILLDWTQFKPSKWKKIGKALLKLAGSYVSSEAVELVSAGVRKLFGWITSHFNEEKS